MVMKLSKDSSPLTRELQVDKDLLREFKVGWRYVFELNTGEHCIVGDYHHQIVRSVFRDPGNIVELPLDLIGPRESE